MAIHVLLNHRTEYKYDRAVNLSPHIIRLRPAPHTRTPIHAYSLKIKPENHFINWQQDSFGNYLARVVFPEKTRVLDIEVELVAEMTVINPFDFFVEEYAEYFPFDYTKQLSTELHPYREIKDSGPLLNKYLLKIDRSKQKINDFLVATNQMLANEIEYTVRLDPGIQSCETTLKKALGSCRDTAWLLVQILRRLGLAARFVSGYLVQLTADVKALDGPSGTDKDFTDLHAWAEVYIPGAGWLGLDPTSGLFAGEGHIPLSCTPDPVSAAPITGGSDEAKTEFYFHNHIKRIHEDPRVTKPYTDEQWQAIKSLGEGIDVQLKEDDVHLTMGGEPTFVSIDDMDSPQWNIAALGDDKRRLADVLIVKLFDHFAPGGVLQISQGKWYPGEVLPRWNLGCYWRDDGKALWRNQELLGNESNDYGYGIEEADKFTKTLCQYLGLSGKTIQPGYEDVFYYLWKEARLPTNVDPLDNKLDDPLERKRLTALFDSGLEKVTGYALPLQYQTKGNEGAWYSQSWEFRHQHMYLVPGDSPMGLRIPLNSLPWQAEKEMTPERSTFEPRPQLTERWGEVARRYDKLETVSAEQPHADDEFTPGHVIHTSICVQPRSGRLYVFLPPLTHLEHYIDLLAAIEMTAEKLQMQVILEGYQPPNDPRLQRLAITPDPGVIEVNIHPASDWRTLVDNTVKLYELAKHSRLGTEKFMLDGRHSGTGGGNHVTIGAKNPADSPILRRPDMLRSLVSYWQNHPCLSYLFSGLFLGPTSQAPRVDEARDDSLYELEIAFSQIPEGESPSPWLVDRLMRNLLIDVTGNTHRAEFCIDKLYSPDSATGRLGLLEFRAFEMPPHAQMSCVQQLLLRALIAWFWRQPYQRKLIRWDTELHDRFMLPHFVWDDFKDVIADLDQAGYTIKLDWFDPFLEFRFPHYGRVTVRNIELELRWAIEPWHVLGEEVSSYGTSRYVDSSVERLQVRVTGLSGDRYVVTCNGRRLPLRATGIKEEYVAGVRYKAWQPPSGLHPNIAIHAPLVFDIIDTWNNVSLGGCTYHVTHPGGRSYDTFPVNANEAEARRGARFWSHGHTPNASTPPAERPNPDYPYTLDLRYPPVS